MRSKGKESTIDQILIAVTQANKRACRWQHNAVFGCCTVSSTAMYDRITSRYRKSSKSIACRSGPLHTMTWPTG
jgi:hypothetical protein